MKREQARETVKSGEASKGVFRFRSAHESSPFAKAAWLFPLTAFTLIELLVVIVVSLIIFCPAIGAEWVDGRAVSWNCFPSTANSNLPAGLTDIVAISSGVSQNLALRKDGTVVSWGRNTNSAPALNDVVAIAAGNGQSLA